MKKEEKELERIKNQTDYQNMVKKYYKKPTYECQLYDVWL